MNEHLTLLLLSSEATVARRVLLDVSAHGLLRPFVIVDEDFGAVVVDDGTETPIDLTGHLAGLSPSLIRVVNVLPATVGRVPAERTEFLRFDLQKRCTDAGIAFTSIAVAVCGAREHIHRDSFAPQWHANILLAPEDSGASKGMIAVLLDPSRVEVAAAHAATVLGALWTWSDAGPFDNEPLRIAEDVCYVRLARLGTRVIDAGDLATRTLNWALGPSGVWPAPEGTIVHGDAERATANLAGELAAHLEFRFQPLAPPEAINPTTLGIGQAYLAYFRLLRDAVLLKLSSAAASIEERVLSTIEGHVQRQTFGTDSDVVIRVRGVPRGADALVRSVRRVNDLTVLPGVEPPSPAPTPQTWRSLAAAAFAAADGGPLPAGIRSDVLDWQGKRGVIADRTLLAPEPTLGSGTGFVLSNEDLASLGIDDPDGVGRMVGGADVFAARSVERLFSLVRPPEGSAPQPPPPPPPANAGSAPAPANSAAPAIPPRRRAPTVSELRRIQPSADLIERFTTWRTERERSLLWQLGTRLADGIGQALDDLGNTHRDLEQIGAEFQRYRAEAEALLRRRRRRVLTTLIAIPLLLATSAYTYHRLSSRLGLGLAVAGVLACIALPLVVIPIVREQLRLEAQLRRLLQRLEWLPRRRNRAVAEAVRLAALNDQLIEWVDVLAQSIHRPWGEPGHAGTEPTWNGESGLRALTGGTPQFDPEAIQGQVTRLRRALCRPGWLHAAYLETRRNWQLRYALVAGLDPASVPDPEADHGSSRQAIGTNPITGESVFGPRVQLCREIVARVHADTVARNAAGTCRAALLTSDTERMISTVRCAAPGLDGLSAQDFLSSLVEFSPLPSFNADYFGPTLGGTSGVLAASYFALSPPLTYQRPADDVPRVRLAACAVERRHVLAAYRLDVTDALPQEVFKMTGTPSARRLPADEPAPAAAEPYEGVG